MACNFITRIEISDLLMQLQDPEKLEEDQVKNKIDTICKGLLLSYKKVFNTYITHEPAEFLNFINKKVYKYEHILEKAFVLYQKILTNYSIDENFTEDCAFVEDAFYFKWTPLILMKIVKKSLLVSKAEQSVLLQYKKLNLHLIVSHTDDEFQLLRWSGEERSFDSLYYINESHDAMIQKVFDVTQGSVKVIKFALKRGACGFKGAIDLLENEYDKLSFIHKEKQKRMITACSRKNYPSI